MSEPAGMFDQTDGKWELQVPFLTDGDDFSDRDRVAFALGFEFAQLYYTWLIMDEPSPCDLHRENESRVRVMCSRMGKRCTITPVDEIWSRVNLEPDDSE